MESVHGNEEASWPCPEGQMKLNVLLVWMLLHAGVALRGSCSPRGQLSAGAPPPRGLLSAGAPPLRGLLSAGASPPRGLLSAGPV